MDQTSVMGLDNDGSATPLLARHTFDFQAAGVTHYVNGEKRAEISAEHWSGYCAGCPEASDAQARRDAAKREETVSGEQPQS